MIGTGPPGPGDLDAVLAVWVACEEHDVRVRPPGRARPRARDVAARLGGGRRAADRRAGCTQSLSVPDAGARALPAAHGYEHVGMHVRKTYAEFAKPL